MKTYFAAILFVFTAAICSGQANDEAAIRGLVDRWAKAYDAHDAGGLAQLYTSDCVRMPEGAPTTIGRDALEKTYRSEFTPSWEKGAKVTFTTDELVICGDYAFARGTDKISELGQSDYHGKWLATFRREKDGQWKFFWSTYNGNEAAKSGK
jgi:uncharacterized protein (TIGR02246 family)